MNKQGLLGLITRRQQETMNNVMNNVSNSKIEPAITVKTDYTIAQAFYMYLEGKTNTLPTSEEINKVIENIEVRGQLIVSAYSGLIVFRGLPDSASLSIEIIEYIDEKSFIKKRITQKKYEVLKVSDYIITEITKDKSKTENYDRIENVINCLKKCYSYRLFQIENVEKYLDLTIEDLKLTVIQQIALYKAGITTLKDLLDADQKYLSSICKLLPDYKTIPFERYKKEKELKIKALNDDEFKTIKLSDLINDDELLKKIEEAGIKDTKKICEDLIFTKIPNLTKNNIEKLQRRTNGKRLYQIIQAKKLEKTKEFKQITFKDLKIKEISIETLKTKYNITTVQQLIEGVLEDKIKTTSYTGYFRDYITIESIEKLIEKKANITKEKELTKGEENMKNEEFIKNHGQLEFSEEIEEIDEEREKEIQERNKFYKSLNNMFEQAKKNNQKPTPKIEEDEIEELDIDETQDEKKQRKENVEKAISMSLQILKEIEENQDNPDKIDELEKELEKYKHYIDRNKETVTPLPAKTLEQKLEIIEAYIEENEENDISPKTVYEGYPIGMWVKEAIIKEEISMLPIDTPEKVINRIRKIYNRSTYDWENGEKEAKPITRRGIMPLELKVKIIEQYIRENGKNDISVATMYRNYPIGKWISNIIEREKKGKLPSNTSFEAIEKIHKIHDTSTHNWKKSQKEKKLQEIKTTKIEKENPYNKKKTNINEEIETINKENQQMKNTAKEKREDIEKLEKQKQLIEEYSKEKETQEKLIKYIQELDEEIKKIQEEIDKLKKGGKKYEKR